MMKKDKRSINISELNAETSTTLLVIEDDQLVRSVIRRMLEAKGHEVVEAEDGRRGILLYRKKPTDLVITDIVMPTKEGLETIREIRRDFPDVKIIAISGGGRISPNDYLDLAKKFGALRTFVKPFEWEDLISAVSEVLSIGED